VRNAVGICKPIDVLSLIVDSHNDVYAYSIVPKTLVQRVSTAADTRHIYQLIANAKFAAGGQDLDSLLKTLRDRWERSAAIQNYPVFVGFGSGEEASAQSTTARFGWMIAPQYRSSQIYEQRDGQYSLAAVISVPTWWRKAELRIATCWLPRRKLTNAGVGAVSPSNRICKNVTPRPIEVRLPGDIKELSQKIGYEVVQQPRLYQQSTPPTVLQVGSPGALVLKGGRLWRSTEVTLGQQLADDIVVLPDMDGIVAKFNCVPPQLRLKPRQPNLELDSTLFGETYAQVSTSEGSTEYAQVLLHTPARYNLETGINPYPDGRPIKASEQPKPPSPSPTDAPTVATSGAPPVQ